MPPKGKSALSAAMLTNLADDPEEQKPEGRSEEQGKAKEQGKEAHQESKQKEQVHDITISLHNDVTTEITKKDVKRLRVQRQITIDPEVLAQAEAFVFQQKQAGERSMSFSKLVEEAVKKELARSSKSTGLRP
jgi:hypothetical protein